MSLYDPELDKAIQDIKKNNAKTVCIQLPDGMKPLAKEIADKITRETNVKIFIWLGSNFGACDIPLGLERLKIDLMISWGHNPFHKKQGW